MSGLHVVSVIYHYDIELETPDRLLARYSTIQPIARALRAQGAEVTVMQRFHHSASFVSDGINFEFCADSCHAKLRKWQVPRSFHGAVQRACKSNHGTGTLVHVHGLFYPLQLAALRRSLPEGCTVVVQHHAERPWRKPFGVIQRRGLRVADGFFFAARELAAPWIERGIISSTHPIYPIMEGSTEFVFQSRASARTVTGMSGQPVVLWVGRLIPLKDPLTVLAGFEQILEQLPAARLYMAYHQPELLAAVQQRIAQSSRLSNAVVLLGQIPHANLESIYNSADYFVLGSHYEGSGFALAEAMACGVVPVVTNIPSFRAMTDEGRLGGSWKPGDARSFVAEFLRAARQPVEVLSKDTISAFHEHLSYPAIARDSMRAYVELMTARQGVRH